MTTQRSGRRSRRRQGGDGLTVIYWRDIPAQVTASANGATAKTMLDPRFQHAIDRAAAVAGLTETEAYIAQWRRSNQPLTGGPEASNPTSAPIDAELQRLVEATADDLSARYSRERLEALVASGGDDDADRVPTTQDEESDR